MSKLQTTPTEANAILLAYLDVPKNWALGLQISSSPKKNPDAKASPSIS
jgi:hypothetical protein